MSRLIAALLLVSAVPMGGAAEVPAAEEQARYDQKREIEKLLLFAAYKRYGGELRTTAILDACGNTGLANAVSSPVTEKAEFLMKEAFRTDAWSDKNRAFLRGLTDEHAVAMYDEVLFALAGYAMGFLDALKLHKDQLPMLCDVGIKLADKLLKERSGK
jgi:hypothetical protein